MAGREVQPHTGPQRKAGPGPERLAVQEERHSLQKKDLGDLEKQIRRE